MACPYNIQRLNSWTTDTTAITNDTMRPVTAPSGKCQLLSCLYDIGRIKLTVATMFLLPQWHHTTTNKCCRYQMGFIAISPRGILLLDIYLFSTATHGQRYITESKKCMQAVYIYICTSNSNATNKSCSVLIRSLGGTSSMQEKIGKIFFEVISKQG